MDKNVFFKIVQAAEIFTDPADIDLPVLTKRGLPYVVSGNVYILGTNISVCVGVSESFPCKEPSFFLLNPNDFEALPHVEENGLICYTNDDNLVLDIDNPVGIIKDCFDLAKQTLIDSLTKKNQDDFYNEYEAYWRRFKNCLSVFTNIEISSKVSLLKYAKIKNAETFFAVTDQTDRLNTYQRFFGSKEAPQFVNGIYIPLLLGSKIFIPKGDLQIKGTLIQELIQQFTSLENQREMKRLLAKPKKDDLIIFSLPQPNGYFSLFGVRLKGINYRQHPLLFSDINFKISPITTTRLDPEFMLARGGTGQKVLNKKILVIGAGAIGSIICEELVKASVLKVDIVDKDILSPENCYRHSCGYRYVNKKKPEAVKAKLEEFFPHSEINAFSIPIEDAIAKKKIDLSNYEAVIVATGNATINQFLSKKFIEQIPGTPILFSWLDPFGIGGHCLVSNLSAEGCFQCLYSNEGLFNSASFAHPSQPKSFSKNISGCGSMYVPYGSLDAINTAILAVRKLLEIFSGKEKHNSIFSWKGDPGLFLSEGYKLSPRFNQCQEELLSAKFLFINQNCKVCGTRRASFPNK